jgi:hypothetical protein
MRFLLLASIIVLPLPALERAAYDSTGRIIALLSDREDLKVTSSLVAVLPTGKRIPVQVRAPRLPLTREGLDLAWSGSFQLPDESRGHFKLRSDEGDFGVRYSATVNAESPLEVAALEWTLDLARADFIGGRVVAGDAAPVVIDVKKPSDGAIYRGNTATVEFRSETGDRVLTLRFDHPRTVAFVDHWDDRGRAYQIRVPLYQRPAEAGSVADLTVELQSGGIAPTPLPVHLALDSSKKPSKFQGFGGNYCWNNASPVSAYTRSNLKLAWARTEMKLVQWDKEKDRPGDAIRADMETMRFFQQKQVPYVTSIWWLPERFYTDPHEKSRMTHFRKIAGDKWDELLELMTGYLFFAKEHYGVEPDLFSFNEANIGVYVGLTPEDHLYAMKRIGAHLRKAGLRTKMLLGDATGPRDTHKFVLAAAADPEAMQYAGAIGFHSWGGGTPEQYTAWGDVAEWLGLPLLVTELGVDAAAYYTRSWNSFHYGLREAQMTQELLTYARPQGTQYWQFTNDYGLARVRTDGTVEPTSRFWLMKHFTDLTPHDSESLAVTSDQKVVLATAFRSNGRYAVHVLNLGAAREAVLDKLPDAVWTMTTTTEAECWQSSAVGRSDQGSLRVALPARGLVTLSSALQ